MNAADILKRIWREKKQWEHDRMGATQCREIEWTLRGINICLNHVRDCIKEDRLHASRRRIKISRWLASDLANAINQALKYLESADRAKAIKVLQKAKELVRMKEQGL